MEPAAARVIPTDARPPIGGDAAPPPGAAGSRSLIRPRLAPPGEGFPPDHPYVRRFWTAAIGPGAVADLLRLTAAARQGGALRRPVHLASLAREGLVGFQRGDLWVRPVVPPLSTAQLRRLPSFLRAEHARWMSDC